MYTNIPTSILHFALVVSLLTATLVFPNRAHGFATECYDNCGPVRLSKGEWPGTRLYTCDNDGNYIYLFTGNEYAFNATLRKYANSEVDDREVVLVAGRGSLTSLQRDRMIEFSWSLYYTPEERRTTYSKDWKTSKVTVTKSKAKLTLYVNDDFSLDKLVIPEGIILVDYYSQPVFINRKIKPFSDDSLNTLIELLDSDNYQRQIDAARSIAAYGLRARRATEALQRCLTSQHIHLREAAQSALDATETTELITDREREYWNNRNRIRIFVEKMER